jgi:hypothetical protein
METCRHGHGDMDMETWTWRHGHGDMNMETWTWRHGHGDMDMEAWTWRYGQGDIKRKIESPGGFPCRWSSCKQKFVVCPFVD